MDTRHPPVRFSQRLISWIVCGLMVWQPMAPAVAAALTPTGQTTVDRAGNGVPVVNIATPNGAGISHNQFGEYNVGKEGLILNNGTDRLTQTQLGGLIQNNPNLQAGREAKGIINEVTGASRSQLQGYTEVAGKAANVMVANPYGITCNGCGFINTPNVTLTTGKPQFDASGNLQALEVTKGAITVEGQGLDASKSDALSIIARATEVNAAIHAKDLTATVGANRVAADGSVTPITGEGAAPVVAVDTGALGGMYANRIRLVSSEKGVGVNLGDLNARQGDITLDTNGKLMVNNSLASGSLTAKADSVVLSGEHKSTGAMLINSRSDVAVTNGKLLSDGDITLAGNGKLSVANGTLTAGKNISLNSGSLTADTTSEVNAAGTIQANVAGAANHAGKMVAGSGISLSAGQLANSGKMTANGDLNVKAGGFTNSGAVQAQKNTRLDLGTLNHTGQLLAGGVLEISTGDAWIDGMLSSDSDLSVSGTGALNIGQNGQLLSTGRLGLQSDSVINNGLVSGKQNLALTSRQFSALQGSTLTSGGSLQLNAGDAQIAGEVLAQGDLSFSGDRLTTLASGQLQSQGDMLLQAHNAAGLDGVQAAKGNLTLAAGSLTHRGTSRGSNVSLQANQIDTSGTLQADNAMALSAETIVQQAGGALLAQKTLQLNTSQLTNSGSLDSDALTLAITGHTDNHASGKMTARNGLTLTGNTFTNDGQLAASALALTLNNAFTNTASGSVLAENTLDLTAPVFNNAGRVASSALNLNANTLDNSGLLQGGQTLQLASTRLANQSGGKIISGSGLTLNIPQLVNAGLISVKQGLTIESLMLTNSGNLEAQSMALKAGQKLSNQQGGVLLAEASLALTTPAFDNAGSVQGKTLTIDAGEWSNGGQASGLDDLSVNVRDTFTNLADGRLVSQQTGRVNAGKFANFGGVTAENLRISGNSLTNDGWLQSGGALDLNVGALANGLSGTVQAGSGLAVTVQQLVNAGAISAQQGAAIDALTLDNNGRIEAQDLQLKLREKLNNLAEGILLAQRSLKLATPQLSNDGRLMSESATLNAKTLVNKGLLQGSAALVADGEQFNNASEGEVVSGGTLTFNETLGFSNAGKVQGETIGLNTRKADNNGQMLGLSALSLSGTESLTNSGNLLSKGKLGLTSEQLDNQGQIAAPELNINTRQMTNSGLLQGDQLFGFTASSLHNQKQGSIISGSGLRLAIPDLINAGLISVTQGLAIEAATLDNAGNIEAKDLQLTLRQQLNNQAKGVLLADDSLHLSTPEFTNRGQLISRSGTIIANTLSNAGLLQGNQGLSVSSQTLDNLSGGQLLSGGALTLNTVQGGNAGRLQGDTVQIGAGRLDNSGQVLAINGLSLTAGELNNTAGAEMSGSGGSLHVDRLVNAGLISVSQGLAIDALTLTNGGNIEAGNLALTSVQTLNNQTSGVLLADDILSIDAASGDNAGKLISSNARLAVSSLTNSGLIQGNQSLGLQGSQLNNIASGQLLSDGDVGLNVDRLDNAGRVQGKSLTLAGGQSGGVNRGQMLGREALNILFAGAFNNDGRLISQNSLSLKSGALSNTGVIAAATVNIDSAVGQANNSGLIQADGKLSFSAASLSNQKSGSLVAGDDIALTVPALINDGLMSTGKNLRLDGTSLDNRGGLEALNVQLNLSGQVNNQPEGHLFADDLLTLNAGSWRNDGQLIGNNVIITSGHGQNSGLLQGDIGLKLAVTGLDNDQAGKILSGGLLDITGQQLNNNGLMQGQNALLHGVDFTNAGSLTGKGDLTLNVDNTATISGQMLSQGKLQLDASQLDNSGILAANTVSVSTGELNNTGTLQSNGALNLVADAFSNVGTLLAKQALNLTSAMLTNSGVIQADTLTLAVKNALTNRDTGKVLATQALAFDGNTLTNSGTLAADNAHLALGILNNSGLVQGNSGLAIQGQAAQTSGLRSVDAAQTPAAKVINNLIVGQLLSGGDLTIAGDKGDNAGTLQGRTLNVKAGSWNNEGTLLGQQGASLNVSSTLTNSGTLLSEAGFDIRAGAVDNRGQLAAGTLNLQSDSISNSGLLQGSAALTFDTRALDNLTGGQILSGGSLNLDLPQLTNQGLLLSQQGLTLNLDNLDNQGIVQARDLGLNIGNQLTNQQSGRLLAQQGLNLTAARLDNAGQLAASNATLAVNILNNRGVLQGDGGLSITAPTLNNLTGGKLLSGGQLTLKAGQLANGGIMQGQRLGVNASGWNNSGSVLGTDGLTAQIDNQLTNTGRLLGQGSTRVAAGALNNQGSLLVDGDLILDGGSLSNGGSLQGSTLTVNSGTVDNAGSVIGLNALTLQPLQGLTNRAGASMKTQGTLLAGGQSITNDGLWQSQYLKVNARQLQNNGTLQSAGNTDLALTSSLVNTGSMVANGTATLGAPTLKNQGQMLAKKMSLSGGSLSNSGSISGADGLGVTLSGDLDQQAGAKLLSNGLLSMGANILTNLGHIQGSTLALNAGSLNNQGRMEANTALNATLRGNVDNGRNAVMLSQGAFQLGAQTLNNDGTLQGNGNTQLDLRDRGSNQGQLLSGATLTLNTPGLTNSGWVQGFALWLNAGSLNNSGTVLAQQQGTLGGNYIVNNGMLQGANLTVNPGQLDNNGTVYATQNLGIAASQVNNAAAARMLSQGNLAINATNTGLQGQVVALGDLTLASKASYNQLTTLAAGNTLSVTSQGDITTNGLMQGKGIQLSAAGTLNNNGQLRAGYGESQLSAGQLNLNGTGSVEAGGTLRLSSLNGINNAGFVGTAGDLIASAGSTLLNSALLYAGNNMSLLANSIRNARGDILAGNSLWMQRDSAGNASAEVVNTSGSIETQRGDISILTGHLVNERDGLNAAQSETNIAPSWVKGGTADIPVDWISSSGTGKYGIYVTEGQSYHGHGDDWSEMLGNYAPYEDADVQKVAVKTVSVSVSAKGQQSRIASGRDIIARSDNVENMASSILANRNIQLSGSTLNNQSWLNGTSTVYNVYRYGVGDKYARRPDETTRSYDKLVSKSISYVLDSVTTEGASGDVYRAVIQAGGAVVASFSNNISNTSTTANAPGYKPGLSAPGLNLSGGPTVASGAKATGLGAASSQSVAAPQATINLPGGGSGIGNAEALTSRNAGNNGLASIDNRPQSIGDFGQAGGKLADVHLQAAGLTSQNGANGTPVDLTGTGAALVVLGSTGGKHTTIASDAVALAGQKQSGTSGTSALASRDKIGEIAAVTAQIISLSSGGKTPPPPGYNYRPVSLTDISSVAPALTSNGSPIKLSDYPLPANNNGYFVANRDPKSPYLIVTNPKLAGLGQLDSSLFNDLYKLAGTTPPSAPQETRTTYTDTTQFLGSDYFLARLNLRPEYDYRFLGDAAFDTRYVSNQILNETGSRYVNGVGSDLEQMQYLIDRAAQARDKLGLQLGVSLSEEQVASLDSSILWWENTVIEGQNVLVPRLYLSAKDVAFNKGSIIAGNQVILNAGSITNDGSTLQGKSLLAASSQSTINNINGGLIGSSGSLQLSALGNINNVGSTISGQTVSLESVGGSIINQTLTNQWNISGATNGWNSQAVSLTQTDLGALASIKATDSLTLSAGKDINNIGANLSAGGDMLLKALDDISVTGNQLVTRDRYGRNLNETVTNQGSTVTSGGNLGLQAGHDLNVTGSNLTAGGSAALWAGNDLVLDVAQNSRHSQTAKTDSLKTDNTRTVISAGDDLTLAAGRDLHSNAAALAAQDRVGLQAGRDIDLLAAESTTSDKYSAKKKVEINQSVRQQGTEIASGSSTTIIANRDVNTQAAQVTAHGDIGVGAGRDINLATATDSDYHYKEQTKTRKGFLSKKTTHTIEENSATRESGSLLSGDNVQVVAGNNLRVSGSAVAGDGDVQLKAGNNVDIVAATNTDTSWRFKEEKKSGLMGSGGIGFTIGSSKSTQDLREKGTTQSQSFSTVGSTGGSVDIAAGNQLHVGGADLVAGKNMALTGDSVTIEPGHDRLTSDQTFKQKSSGLTIALSGAVGDAVNTAASTAMAVKDQSDGRLAALQATKAALSGVQAVQANRLAEAANGSDPTNNGAFGVMASIGGQSSKSTSHSEQDKTTGSTLNAGGNLAITATGQGNAANSGDITVAGSQLKAGKDLTLNAAQDINLTSAADTNKLTGSNSSKGGSIGIGITAGPNGAGITVSASVNAARGSEKGNGTSWNETTLDAGQNVNLTSGRDTVLKGAQVNGDKVTADVGRDLTLSSLQDSDKYNSKQQSMNAGASYTWGAGSGSGSFSISRDKMKSNYDSVQEQTGIFAGKGGFDINVGNHTQLDGAVIASRADADKNRLETGTLGFTDINNKAEYKVEHQGVGFSSGAGVAGNLVSNMASTMLAGMGGGGHAEGTTQSAVADGAIIVRDQANQKQDVSTLSRDTDHANGSIDPIFNKEKEQKRLQTAQMIGEIGNQVADIARTNGKIAATEAANEKMKTAGSDARNAAISQLKKDGKEVTDQAIHDQMYQTFYNEAFNQSGMGTGQSTQRAITAATAGIQALAGGDIKAAIAGGAAPYIANAIANAIPETDLKGRVLAHAVVNAALAAASGRDAASAAAGAAVGELVGKIAVDKLAGKIAVDGFGKQVSELSEEEKQTVSALATLASGLAGGLVGDSSANAVAAAQAGKTTVENNTLSPGHDEEEFEKEHGDRLPKVYNIARPGVLFDEDGKPLPGTAGLGIGAVPIGGKSKDTQIWTETKKAEPVDNAYGHWTKHGKEFPEYQNSKQYVDATHNFVTNPPKGTLTTIRKNGDTIYYNPSSNTFAVKNSDGVPKTMFRPDPADHGYPTNLDYFNAQK
ncbi:hemagglutinin repeat-containing protein [Enterobacter roggenkampii]|nr:hemagglutinin repeat-containing protein [Enterobacter roggenkampii]